MGLIKPNLYVPRAVHATNFEDVKIDVGKEHSDHNLYYFMENERI